MKNATWSIRDAGGQKPTIDGEKKNMAKIFRGNKREGKEREEEEQGCDTATATWKIAPIYEEPEPGAAGGRRSWASDAQGSGQLKRACRTANSAGFWLAQAGGRRC